MTNDLTTKPVTHTAGPWEAVGSVVRTVRDGEGHGGFLIAECSPLQEHRADDARLIAAAPDLLAVLKALVDPAAPFTREDLNHARAVIAKAEGK